jgi:hypothetical protein
MPNRHVFLSFVAEDLTLVNLFRGQARNKNSNLTFDDYSVKVPYNSTRADYIRGRIRAQIRASSVLVCLVGRQTSRSRWVNWEIQTANQMGKRIIGVRLRPARDPLPVALAEARARIVAWDIPAIVSLIG